MDQYIMNFSPSRRSDIEAFRALANLREVNKRIAAGQDIVRLEYGQPCFGAPAPVLDHARQNLLDDPRQGYTSAVGMPALQQRIARYYAENYGYKNLNPDRAVITIGSSGGFIFAFLAAFDAGDTVALITPTYPAYRNILRSLDINVVEIPASADTNYQPTVELLKNSGKKFKGLIINSPANPTGCMIDKAELKRICEWCENNGVRLISDEAYHRITYGTAAETALHHTPNGIITNTFSKYFAMTGWRLGWIILPEGEMIDRVKKLAENLFVSPPTMSQFIATNIFDHLPALDAYVAHYKINRDILMKGLPETGMKLSAAEGAFYIYVDLSALTNDSAAFCSKMLDEAKVSCTSGLDFDPIRGHQTMRISYAGKPEDMHEAVKRLKTWLL